jgi:mannose-6-phosphate isomerase-like protein (cupin superfamily)
MKLALADALARVPTPEGKRFALLFERGTLEIEIYAPRGLDPQQPHRKDELYVVVAGQGTFVCGDQRDPFGPGDCLFAAAGVPHRFEDFSDDLVVWVVFYGPDGGERPGRD